MPDQAIHGIEWAMTHTNLQFLNRVVGQWKVKTSVDNGRIVFPYWTDCVTGRANTIWIAVVNEHAKDDAAKTFESWQTCIGFYLEKIQNVSYIGDAVCDKNSVLETSSHGLFY